ncbi:MAG: prolyl oligopeptidase family serine peptidase [Verrucomicrobia bacterium]|nr:prolyl oligopeptidase family serine peptidase [Verrucomicrobiota bacterium]
MPRPTQFSIWPRFIGLLFASLSVFGAGATVGRPATPAVALNPFFAPPEFNNPIIAPDGKHIAFFTESGNRTYLLSYELATKKVQLLSTAEQGNVKEVWWLGSDRVLFYTFSKTEPAYFLQDLRGSTPRRIKSLTGMRPLWLKSMADDPSHVIAYMIRWDGGSDFDLEILTGRADLDKDNIQTYGTAQHGIPVLSATGELRATNDIHEHKWTVAWRADGSSPWSKLQGDGDKPRFEPRGLARDGRHIIVLARDQGDTTAAMSLDPVTGERTLLAQRPDRDVQDFIWDPTNNFIIGVEFYRYGQRDTAFFEPADAKRQASIDQALPGARNWLLSSSSDGQLQIILSVGPSCAPVFSLLDRKQGRISELNAQYPSLKPGKLGRTENFQFKCSDGLTAYGYVVLPPASTTRGPAPLLVMTPDQAGEAPTTPTRYSAIDQYLASRGYAVAHFAVHGNTGFGERFLKAGAFQFADQVPRDFEAGLRCLTESGLIDAKRVAVLGTARSGLLALRMAANSNSYRSVITINTPGTLKIGALLWLYTDDIDLTKLVTQVGGDKKAYELLRVFYPESYVSRLSASTLVVYDRYSYSTYDSTHATRRALEYCLKDNHKPYESYEIDPDATEKESRNAYTQQLWTKVADYLDKTLK